MRDIRTASCPYTGSCVAGGCSRSPVWRSLTCWQICHFAAATGDCVAVTPLMFRRCTVCGVARCADVGRSDDTFATNWKSQMMATVTLTIPM
jgi:hypothetical protein